ncbi:MAG TPA: FtsK/SpoIIIE domain-containing protein [Phycisphaerae bacterium]|nr:FtsK/SpoIIIE domain-containing protein [Phycisphaerae bacterium]
MPDAPPPLPDSPLDGAYVRRQRAALRDLLELSAECDRQDQQIERRFQDGRERVTTRHDRLEQYLRGRLVRLRGEMEARHHRQRQRLEEQIGRQRTQAAADRERWLQQVRDQGAADLDTLTQRLNHALWLADSVFEGAEAGLKGDQGELRDELARQRHALDGIEEQANHHLQRYRQSYTLADLPAGEKPAAVGDPAQAYRQASEELARHRAALRDLTAPKWFGGWRLAVALALPLAVTAAVTGWIAYVTGQALSGTVGIGMLVLAGALATTFLLVAITWYVAGKQVRRIAAPLKQALVRARHALDACSRHTRTTAEETYRQARRQRQSEAEAAKATFEPALAERRRQLEEELTEASRQAEAVARQQEEERQQELRQLLDGHRRQREQLEARYERHLAAAGGRRARLTGEIQARYDADRVALQARWSEGLGRVQGLVEESQRLDQFLDVPWEKVCHADRLPSAGDLHLARFGRLHVDLGRIAAGRGCSGRYKIDVPTTFDLPAVLAFPQQGSLLIHTQRDGRERAIAALHAVMLRLLTSLPPGRVRLSLLDPVGLGQNFAGFMHLADYDESLVGTRIWSEPEHIEQRLTDLTQHMENVIQKYLRNDFDTIVRYNEQAGELAEPYRFVVVADFPANFTDEAAQRLVSIAHSGPRCGVYTLIVRNAWQELPHGLEEADLRESAVVLKQDGDRLVWDDEVYGRFPLTVDAPPAEGVKTDIFRQVGEGARRAANVEVPFDAIVPGEDRLWSARTPRDLTVPMGRCGATRLQYLTLGRGMAQHVLIAGKTGSGKSTLLHVLITDLALWYSPDEVQFYLIDFKKGVEFKTYATHRLPHAKAIAIESDREFGLSVLEKLDDEMNRRGELFRAAGVQDLPAYRQERPGEAMPRTLLLIDEFQELFTEDDRLGQRAALLLDRLVRQGRAFGIHVLLGSQTLGGTSGLPRGTMGQMAVRIALQCSEADSQLILSDDNTAAKLLSRPGEAIYNDAGGMIEGNSPFQISWLPDAERDRHLNRVEQLAAERGQTGRPIVFEGNAPADITENAALTERVASWPPAGRPEGPIVWVGEPITIKAPTAARLRRQSGANMALIGQQDEAAQAVLAAAMLSLAAQHPADAARFCLLDGSAPDSPAAGRFDALAAGLPQPLRRAQGREVADALADLAAEMRRRLDGELTDEPPVFLLVFGLQRFRMLRRSEDDFGFSSSEASEGAPPRPEKQFAELLREGPGLGIHTIAWCDTLASLERTLDRQSIREFDYRVLFQMSATDSSNLIDSPEANRLGFYRALLYSEERGYQEKFRPYAFPPRQWLADFAAKTRGADH